MNNSIKIGALVKTIGYQCFKKEEEQKKRWPKFLKRGIHRVAKIRRTHFGLLIQTDRQTRWLNSNWFREVEEEE